MRFQIINNDLDNIIKLEDITCNSSTNKFNIDDYDIYQYNKIIFIRLKFTIVNESIESNSTVRIQFSENIPKCISEGFSSICTYNGTDLVLGYFYSYNKTLQLRFVNTYQVGIGSDISFMYISQ